MRVSATNSAAMQIDSEKALESRAQVLVDFLVSQIGIPEILSGRSEKPQS
jgi:hypothetical protein